MSTSDYHIRRVPGPGPSGRNTEPVGGNPSGPAGRFPTRHKKTPGAGRPRGCEGALTRLFLLHVARGRAVELDLHPFLQLVVVLIQDRDHLRLGEFRRNRLAPAHELAEGGARGEEAGAAPLVSRFRDYGPSP